MKQFLGLAVAICVFGAEPLAVAPSKMPRRGTVDERFQSYNVEMVEVTGGRFWAPYRDEGKASEPTAASTLAVPGIDPSLFRTRQPIDLSNPRLRKLAAGIGHLTCASVAPGRTPPTSTTPTPSHRRHHRMVLAESSLVNNGGASLTSHKPSTPRS